MREIKRTEIMDSINAKLLDRAAKQGREVTAKSAATGAVLGVLVSAGSGCKPLTIGLWSGLGAMFGVLVAEALN